MQFIEFLVLFSLFGAAYSYFLYPLILLVLPKQNEYELTSTTTYNEQSPLISFIITAYNEEKRIEEKILDTLATEYPKEKLEILVASDGSTDNTNLVALNYRDQGVKLIEVKERKGKENAQLAAISQAQGEILIFSDTATKISPDSIGIIAETFKNKKIGSISSEDRFISDDGEIAGEGAYVKYEMWLRRLEARVKSLVGLSGSFFACRKSICNDWNINIPSDFNTALNSVSNGYIAISHPNVLGFYPNLKDESKEYQRKLRTVIRGMAALASNLYVLNPLHFGLFAFQIFSHKLMRWLVPWFQLLLLIFTIAAIEIHEIYILLFIAQIAFYSLALFGALFKTSRKLQLVKIPFFFSQVNIAIAHAGILFLSGKRITKWEPSKR